MQGLRVDANGPGHCPWSRGPRRQRAGENPGAPGLLSAGDPWAWGPLGALTSRDKEMIYSSLDRERPEVTNSMTAM